MKKKKYNIWNIPYIEPNTMAKILFDAKTKTTHIKFMGCFFKIDASEAGNIGFTVLYKHLYDTTLTDYTVLSKMIQEEMLERVVSRWINTKE